MYFLNRMRFHCSMESYNANQVMNLEEQNGEHLGDKINKNSGVVSQKYEKVCLMSKCFQIFIPYIELVSLVLKKDKR